MLHHIAGNLYGYKFLWIFQKSVLPKFSQFLILQQGSRPVTTPLYFTVNVWPLLENSACTSAWKRWYVHCNEVNHICRSLFAYLFISSFNGYGTDDSWQIRSLWGMAVLVQVGSSNRASYSRGGRILWEQIIGRFKFFFVLAFKCKNFTSQKFPTIH